MVWLLSWLYMLSVVFVFMERGRNWVFIVCIV